MFVKFISDILTESDNKTYSLQRVGITFGLIMAAAAFGSHVWRNSVTPETYQAFAVAWAGILMAGGLGSKLTPETPHTG